MRSKHKINHQEKHNAENMTTVGLYQLVTDQQIIEKESIMFKVKRMHAAQVLKSIKIEVKLS